MNKKYGGLVSNPRNTKDTQVVKSITYTTNGTVVETVNLNAWPAATESNTPSPTPVSPTLRGLRVYGDSLQYYVNEKWVDVSFQNKVVLGNWDDEEESININYTPSPISDVETGLEIVTTTKDAGVDAVPIVVNVQNDGIKVTIGSLELGTLIVGDESPIMVIE